MANDTLFNNYSTEFQNNWEVKAQQKTHRLLGTYMPDTFQGKSKMYSRIGTQEAQDQTTRKGDTPITNPDTDQRWIYHGVKELGNDMDQFDEQLLGQVVLPNSEYVNGHAMAFNRAMDRTLINAAIGTAYSGLNGTTSNALPGNGTSTGATIQSTWDSGGTGAAGVTPIGLTLSKLLRLRELAADNNIDVDGQDGGDDELIMAVTMKQITDLLKDVKLTSRDYTGEVTNLRDGKINSFLGIRFIRLTSTTDAGPLLPVASGVRTCVAWSKSALRLATGESKTTIDRIAEKSNKIQIYSVKKMGAVRLWDDRVFQVLCAEL
jgi:hypothetical protein